MVERTQLRSWYTLSGERWSSVTTFEAYTKAAGPWFEHSNVCVDHGDQIKYFENDDFDYRRNATLTGALKGIPHRPKPFLWAGEPARNGRPADSSEYGGKSPVYVLKGKTLMLHCWRVQNNPHPLHFLFGYGALLSVLFAPASVFWNQLVCKTRLKGHLKK